MRCPKCKFIVAEYFETCPECQEDLSEIAKALGPFYEPNPEIFEAPWEEEEGPAEEILYDKLDEKLVSPEEETIAVAEAPEMDLEEIAEDLEEISLEDLSEELEAVEEIPEIELGEEDLKETLREDLAPHEEEPEALDLFEGLEGLEEILPEEIKEEENKDR